MEQMTLMNIARSGIFAADHSIRDYARDMERAGARPQVNLLRSVSRRPIRTAAFTFH